MYPKDNADCEAIIDLALAGPGVSVEGWRVLAEGGGDWVRPQGDSRRG